MSDQLNLGLLLLRVATAIVILAHGYNHIFRGGKINGTAGWFASMGMKPGILHAWLASATELASGVLLLLGFLTPFAAGGVLGVMLVAFMTAHRTNGFFIFRPGQGWEYVMYIAVVCVAIGTMGPGQWAIDYHAKIFHGWDGLIWTLVAGVGGAAALLAFFWRPEKQPAS
jgi:putative oxidoreductase